jgi:hypothetical protein
LQIVDKISFKTESKIKMFSRYVKLNVDSLPPKLYYKKYSRKPFREKEEEATRIYGSTQRDAALEILPFCWESNCKQDSCLSSLLTILEKVCCCHSPKQVQPGGVQVLP